MINSVKLTFGSSGTAAPLTFDPKPITIFVGPNNSGKSLTLREIETWCSEGPQQQRRIVDAIDVQMPDAEQAIKELTPFRRTPREGETIREGFIILKKPNPHQESVPEMQMHEQSLKTQWNFRDWSYISNYYLDFFTIRLDGRTRFSLTQPRPSGDLKGLAHNHLAALFQDDEARYKIREIIADAFGLYFVIDPTGMTQFTIRMSKRVPRDNQEEQALDERSRAFHTSATEIAALSDGVQAFTGILAAVLSSNYKIVLIDEPEAFLAPGLRRKLGNRLATLAQEREVTLFAATHDSDFLMGCIQAGSNINVVRLTYNGGRATARPLPPETLVRFMRDPLLRSTNVLDALFHESAVVTEGDTDRAFYQEINERLLGHNREGIDNSLFLNARNKQTVPQVAGPLREIGIPAAMIVDIDVLKDGGREWSRLLDAANVPTTSRNALNGHRAAVKKAFDASDMDMKQDGGIHILEDDAKESCGSLLDQLADYGIFVVPSGEVESWLPELNVGGHGPEWLIPVFEKMKSNPRDPNYVRPREGDVWKFIEAIDRWIRNESRKGMPT